MEDSVKATMAARASESSAAETAKHIEQAAEKNEDPQVAEELRQAAVAADSTVVRVGWLRSTLTRLFHPEPV